MRDPDATFEPPVVAQRPTKPLQDVAPKSVVGEVTTGLQAQLKITRANKRDVRVMSLSKPQYIIGRTDADVTLEQGAVSRVHALLMRGPFGNWWVYDLGSTNGTLVNGSRVHDRLLSPGDAISIAGYTLLFQDSEDEAAKLRNAPRELEPSTKTARNLDPQRTMVMPADLLDARSLSVTHLNSLMSLSRELQRIEPVKGRLRHICRHMVGDPFRVMHAAVVMPLASDKGYKMIVGPINIAGSEESMSPLSRSVLQALMSTREPVMASNVESGDAELDQASIGLTLPRQVREVTVIACPLRRSGAEMHCLYLELPGAYATSEWFSLSTFVAEIANQADAAWEMRQNARHAASLEKELAMARQIQDGLLPRDRHIASGLEVAFGYRPCRWVGGDYVDVIEREDGRILLAIADVCGKGMQAALVASSLHTLVASNADSSRPLAQLMERINAYFYRYLPDHSFVTMLALLYDPKTGELECVNAGHPAAVIVDVSGAQRTLQSEQNVPLGVIDTEMHASVETIAPDEVLLLFTDGLSEALDEDNHLLGESALSKLLATIVVEQPSGTASALRDKFFDRFESITSSEVATDDRTFLVARRLPQARTSP